MADGGRQRAALVEAQHLVEALELVVEQTSPLAEYLPGLLAEEDIDVYHTPLFVAPIVRACRCVVTLHDVIPLTHPDLVPEPHPPLGACVLLDPGEGDGVDRLLRTSIALGGPLADGLGDACDACPLDDQNDIDGDTVCGDVDNCPTVARSEERFSRNAATAHESRMPSSA